MHTFSIWEIANILCRLGVAGIVIVKLVAFYNSYTLDERIGLGIAGGCSLITVVELGGWPHSPFSHWPSAFFAFGVMVYFIGRLRRQIRHRWNNEKMLRNARRRGLKLKENRNG